MIHDSTDEKIRKPRRLRNTPLQKYIRLASLSTTFLFALGIYFSIKRSIVSYDKQAIEIRDIFDADERAMAEDYNNIFLRSIIDQLVERKETRLKAEAELKSIESNK